MNSLQVPKKNYKNFRPSMIAFTDSNNLLSQLEDVFSKKWNRASENRLETQG